MSLSQTRRISALTCALLLASPLAVRAQDYPPGNDMSNPSKLASLLEGDWTIQLGRMTSGKSVPHSLIYTQALFIWRVIRSRYLFEDLRPARDGALLGTWRRADSAQKQAARLLVSASDSALFVAGLNGWTEPTGELTGRRGYIPPRNSMSGARLITGKWCTPAGMLRIRVPAPPPRA